MNKKKMCLIWHEAGNDLYQDRFSALSKLFDLKVYGPRKFMGKTFQEISKKEWSSALFDCFLVMHWLTYFSYKMIRSVRKERFDIIYIHEEPHSLLAFFIVIFCPAKVRVLETSVINMKGNFKGFNFLEKIVYKKIDAILPKNKEVAQVLVARGADKNKIYSPIGNGVSKETFDVVDKIKARKKMFGDSFEGKLVLGFAGRIWQPKGLEILIPLAQENNYKVIVCGGVLDDWLLDKLKKSGVLYIGELKKNELNCFYSSLDIFILPSLNTPYWREQFGRVCAEAIYCGTPAIGSNVGGIPMVIGEQNTFEAGDIDSLRAKIKNLRDDQMRVDKLQEQHEHVVENFSWSAIANQVAHVVRGIKC
ncbi:MULTISPECIES: glycosyltransferase family 4 protein [unclassified Oceanobacter]|uniref:glycosyltransferase family 4 protein n=1 Tax=unclassified Oceanobacter TaxID=2620260 RepID=UPI0026E144A9|nr:MULTISPECIES: glycosyltransferase family 4 protein [unclassified Oceanobacter]MDO6681327.1 glycosyltransferase family 4 protein [Oceanobacter sp. 5_MG-2023]MDP2505038.1 glycosyltransferase family 4 protein [Oceanobacter sp. 3_MG-2023]